MLYELAGSLWYPPLPTVSMLANPFSNPTLTTMSATGHKFAFIGRVYIAGRPAGTKTISAAGGGSIGFTPGGSGFTWADAATNLRIGIQDADTSGFPVVPDGSYDVYADLVPGTDTLTANTWKTVAMESGTKAISHGDLICIIFELTARGGSDVISANGFAVSSAENTPIVKRYTTSWQTPDAAVPAVIIAFDDGTLGRIHGGWGGCVSGTSETFASATNPNERGNAFSLPFHCTIGAIQTSLIVNSLNIDFSLKIYSDPFGVSPVAEVTIARPAEESSSLSGNRIVHIPLSTPFEVQPNTPYGVTLLATGSANLNPYLGGFADNAHKALHGLSTDWKKITRNGSSGPFASDDTLLYPIFLGLTAIEDGSPAPTLSLGAVS